MNEQRELAVASLTASATPNHSHFDVRRPIMGAPEPLNVPAVRAEEPAALRPSLNSEFDVHIDEAAARHGVSRELVRAIIQVESGFDRLALSGAGARGLMQLMPATARRFGVINRFDARQSPPYKQTQDYVRKVSALLGAALKETDDGPSGDGGKG